MSGPGYLHTQLANGGWLWYLVNSHDQIVYHSPYRYGSRQDAISAARKSGVRFIG